MKKMDILGRDKFVDSMLQFVQCLSQNRSNSIFAIDGQWGTGKTYVLDLFEEQLKCIQSEDTNDNRYLVFHYNCWKYDYYEEPAIAIVASMHDTIEQECSILGASADKVVLGGFDQAKKVLADIAGEFVKNKIGIDMVQIVQDIQEDVNNQKDADKAFDNMFTFQKTLLEMREKLEDLSKDKTIVFVVDELDRCMPSYAIKVMERIHHIFEDMSNIVVVLAIDSTQLSHSIRQIFGKDVSVNNYLNKFIDFTFCLDAGEVSREFSEKYVDIYDKFQVSIPAHNGQFEYLYYNIYSGLDIRTQEKLINRAYILHENICGNEKYDLSLLAFEILWVALLHSQLTDKVVELLNTISSPIISQQVAGDNRCLKYLQHELNKVYKAKKDVSGAAVCLESDLFDKVIWFLQTGVETVVAFDYAGEQNIEQESNWSQAFRQIAESMKWN